MSGQSTLDKYLDEFQARYRARTPRSLKLFQKALANLPGGDTRAAVFFLPYPTFIAGGEGCRVTDVDGNTYIDHLNNFTVQIHGHNHPQIRAAAQEQLAKGASFGAPHEKQIELAEILCQRFPSLERVRFCNSGSEATQFAIRAARAYTGKSILVKMEGIYNGSEDTVEASIAPALSAAGPFDRPNLIPSSPGVPKGVFDHIVIAPFNNLPATRAIIEENKDDLAGIIIEPIMSACGVIPAQEEYLRYLREAATELGAVLIFDEVVTSRLSPGGAQQIYGITPDLTAMGKYIGGGMPVGAFGGRAEIMEIFSPFGGKVSHSGTFNGHPVTMAAGVEAMKLLDPEAIQRLNALGDRFREGINRDIFGALGIRAQAFGIGSISIIHYTDGPIRNYRDFKKALEEAGELPFLVHLGHVNNGIWIAERGEYGLSTAMTEKDIDQSIEAMKRTYASIRPVLEKDFPHLIAG